MTLIQNHIVFHGHGSEYPFSRLAREMRARGHSVVEADMSVAGWCRSALDYVRDGDVTLVSSHHPLATKFDYQTYYGLDDDVLSLKQTQSLFKPKQTFFIPHDLTRPLHTFEMPELRHVTAALMPDRSYWFLKRFCRVEAIGWIGLFDETSTDIAESTTWQPATSTPKILFLPSDIANHVRNGRHGFAEDFAGVLGLNPSVKMPRGDGFDPITQVLLDAGCHLLDPKLSVCALVGSYPIIVGSGASSVILEAASAGAKVVAVQDRFAHSGEMSATFGHLPNVHIATPNSLAALLEQLIPEIGLQNGDYIGTKVEPFRIDLLEQLCGFNVP
jgi:hypothetical protein